MLKTYWVGQSESDRQGYCRINIIGENFNIRTLSVICMSPLIFESFDPQATVSTFTTVTNT